MYSQQNPLENVTFVSGNNSNKLACEPEWEWHSSAPMPDYDLWYVLSGKGIMRLKGKEYPVFKGVCILLYPGDRPHATQDPDDRLTFIYNHFDVKEADEKRCFVPPPQYSLFTDTFPIEYMLGRLLNLQDGTQAWKEYEFDYLMKQLFIHLYRLHLSDHQGSGLSARQMEKIQNVAEYIRRESSRRIHIKELSELVHLSPQYLNVLFRKHSGVSLKEYITRARMDKAAYLLSETDMNISQTAEFLGYSDIYVFSKLFKKYVGETPSYFQKNSRSSEPDI